MPGLFLLDYIVAGLIGTVVGVGELVSRYKDNPARAVASLPSRLYLAVNAVASVTALFLLRLFAVDTGQEGLAARVTQVLLGGFGAVAFLRTSLFNVTIAGSPVGIGPNILLTVVLTAADRAVDRRMAEKRAARVGEIMAHVSFEDSSESLKVYCLRGLMQNITPDDEKQVSEVIKELRDPLLSSVPDAVKSFVLGLNLMNIVGEDVLAEAVQQLRPHLHDAAEDHTATAAGPEAGDQAQPTAPPTPDPGR